MARVAANGAIITDNGGWYWDGWKFCPLTPNPASKKPGLFAPERLSVAALIKSLPPQRKNIPSIKAAGEQLVALVAQHGSLAAYEAEASLTVHDRILIELQKLNAAQAEKAEREPTETCATCGAAKTGGGPCRHCGQ